MSTLDKDDTSSLGDTDTEGDAKVPADTAVAVMTEVNSSAQWPIGYEVRYDLTWMWMRMETGRRTRPFYGERK